MFKSQFCISSPSSSLRCVTRYPGQVLISRSHRYHSTTTTTNLEAVEQSKDNTEQQSEQQQADAAAVSVSAEGSAGSPSPDKSLKRSICLDGQSSDINDPRFLPQNIASNTNTNTKQYFKHMQLPSVASTQYLDTSKLKNDIFYNGFRPLLSPIQRPIVKSFNRKPTIPLSWNTSACKLQNFDDFSKVPQFVADKLTPFNKPPSPGSEIRLGNKSRKEIKQQERMSKEVLEFINYFKK